MSARPDATRLPSALLALAVAAGPLAGAEVPADAPHPSVLLVTAHPDDETVFAGSVFKLVHGLGGSVDLAVVTNGEAGFRYATLAEGIYGLPISEERIGRAQLPRIRKRELMAGGAILGLRDYFFLDQPDHGFSQDAAEARRGWNVAWVRRRLGEILERGRYDLVLTLLPTATTHGAHQAATLLALEAVAALPSGRRPAILGATDARRGEPGPALTPRGEMPLARVRSEIPALEFDRSEAFGYQARLDYRIVVGWVVAEHKSQGLLQTDRAPAELELFHVFALNDPPAVAAAEEIFRRLAPGPAREPGTQGVQRRDIGLRDGGACPPPL